MGPAPLAEVARRVLRSPLLPFAALAAFLLWAHEPWRDEAEVWLIARDSPTLAAFFASMRYEGTPALWHLLVMPFAELGFPFLAARVLHSALAVAALGVAWFWAPFGKLEKWLLAFGYYFAYEYNAIARSYALFALLLFVVAALHGSRRERPVRYGVALALLAQSTLHGLIIGGVVAAAYGLEVLRDRAWTRRVTAGAAVVVAGFLLAVVQMLPPADLAPWLSEWHFRDPRTYNSVRSIIAAFIPIPSGEAVFWNSSLFDGLPGSGKMLLAGLLLAGACAALWADKWALGVFAVAAAGLQALFAFKYYGGAHHAGIVFLLFLACLWMARGGARPASPTSPAPSTSPSISPSASPARPTPFAWFLPAILVLQVVAAGVAVEREATGQFSASGAVARYLEETRLLENGTFATVYHSHSGMAILAQLEDRDARFFFPELGRMGSFPPWSAQWQAGTHLTLDQVLAAMDAAHPGPGRRILIEDFPHLEGSPEAKARLRLLASFGDNLVGNREERFNVHEVSAP